MKKIMSILLVLLLAVALLPTAAFAEGPVVMLSNQKLRVDGKTIECERYNIDNRNYFKLRDLAAVLDGTGSQFNVDYDTAAKQMVVTTGVHYTTPNGTELKIGADNSATAQVSSQSLIVDGQLIEGLTVYNIGGGNYFQLRELGDVLGFFVDYDTPSKTMIVISKAPSYPTEWLTVDTVYNDDGAAVSHSRSTYDENGRTLTYLWEDAYCTENYSYTYDDLGRSVSYTYDYVSSYSDEPYEEHSTTTYTYDIWGQLVKTVYEATGDYLSETTRTYDDNGNLLVEETLGNQGKSAYYSSYDENGNLIKYVCTYDDEVSFTHEFVYDDQGREIRYWYTDGDGTVSGLSETTYVSDTETVTTYSYGDYNSTTRYIYDENGYIIRYEWDDGEDSSVETLIYDDQYNLVQDEVLYNSYSRVTVYTYNEMGLKVKDETSSSEGEYIVEEYTYDAAGNLLTDVYNSTGYTRTVSYSYDPASHTKNILVLDEYFGVG